MKKRILTQINGTNSQGEPYSIFHEDEFPINAENEKITLHQLVEENFRLMSLPIDDGDTITFRVETFT